MHEKWQLNWLKRYCHRCVTSKRAWSWKTVQDTKIALIMSRSAPLVPLFLSLSQPLLPHTEKKNPSHKYRKLENGDHLIDSAVIRSHRNIFFFTKNVTISRYVFLLCYSKPSPKVITSISPLYISSSTTFPVFFKINVLIRLDSSSLIFWKCKRYLTSTVLNLHT